MQSRKYIVLVFLITISLVFGSVSPAYAASLPAEINKQFSPLQIDAGGVSVLRISIFNPNIFSLTNAAFVDDLVRVQPGLYVANPAGVVNTCGGTVTATPNSTTISLSGGGVPAQVGATPGQCYIEVNISSVTAGNLINTIPAHNPPTDIGLTADGNDGGTLVQITNTSPASATITVVAVAAPSLSKTFTPNTIFAGQTSQLAIRINNNDVDTNLTGTSYTDTLPSGLIIATPNGLSVNNCGGGASVSAPAGGTTISLTNGTITPSQDCVVSVNVTGTFGQYTNTIPAGPVGPGSITTDQGVTNGSPASANLNIQPVGVTKAFAPNAVVAGGTSTLTITLQNPTGSPYTGVSITDNLPADVTVAGAPTTTCGAGTVSGNPGDTSVTLTNGTIPASGAPPTPATCTIIVPVQVALNATGNRTNTIPANSLNADQPGVTNYLPATNTIAISPALTGTKAYSPTIMALNGISTVTVTLTNNSVSPLTNISFTDSLPAGLNVSAAPATPQCGGTVSSTATSVTLSGGSLAAAPGPGNTCTIVFQVTSTTPGTYENTIPAGDISTGEGVGNNSPITTGTDLTVVNANQLPVTIAKSFQSTTISPGQTVRLRITVTAPVDTAISGLTVTDTLPAGLVIAATPAPTESCPGGTLTAVAGTGFIQYSNLPANSLSAGASCNIDVWVTSTEPDVYVNTIPANSVTTSQGRTNELGDATATLRVTTLTISKAFYPTAVQAGGLSVLTITLQNTNDTALTNVTVTDDLPGSPTTGIRVATPINIVNNTCGFTPSVDPGNEIISLTGGTIPAQSGGVPGICTFSIDVQGLDSSPGSPTTQTNTIPITNVSATVSDTGNVIGPTAQAQANLSIRNLSIGIVKGFNPVLVYGGATSLMTVQLINPQNTQLTGIAFTDNMALLAPGIVLANPVMFNTGTCGGTLTGNPGDSTFSFSGGTLLANSTCTLTLRVLMTVNGNRTNRIPAGAVTTFNGANSTQATEASLTNLPGVSVNKVFNPNPIQVNDITTLTITITNTSNIPVVGMGVNDNLPGTLPSGLYIATPANVVNTCNGTVTANPGDQTIGLTGGSLAGNSTCSISVSVTTNEPGAYVNTIPAGALTADDAAVTNNNPATDTLRVGDLFSLGNRVWFDTNNNGVSDAGTEQGVDNVTVEVYRADAGGNPTGSALATQVTTQGGYYRFDDLAPGDYVVVIPASQFDAGGALAGYQSSGTVIDNAGVISDAISPDPDNDTDNDDNGARVTSGAFNNAVISQPVTLGPNSDEPTNDADMPAMNPAGESANDRSNRTVDFGFYRQQLGDLVFVDVNGNGAYNSGTDSLVAGATVRLYSGDGITEINVGPDGILDTSDDGSSSFTTGPTGIYSFSGLPQGSYVVRVTPPAGFISTVDTANNGDTTNPNNNINNNDNGVGVAGGTVSSNPVTLTPGSAGAAGNNTVTQATGTTVNPTVDFGFVPLFSLGNRVWFDTDNSSTINGSEVGVDNVLVELYAADAGGNPTGPVLATDTTTNNGYYRFDNLAAGNYVVVIPATQLASGGPLAGYWSSGTTLSGAGSIGESAAPDPDNNTDSDDNGELDTSGGTFNGAIISHAVTLGPSANEPTNDSDEESPNPAGEAVNNQSNRTVDFGFYRAELGNLVFVDSNSNGVFDAGDTPLAGATVQLFASNGTTEINVGPDGILGTADDGSGGVTTGAGGTYLFSNLPQGDYIVRVTPPIGYASTVDTADNADTTSPNTNTDNNDNGVGIGVGQASSNAMPLTPGFAGSNNTVDNSSGTTTNPTIDFGFLTNNGFRKMIVATDQTFTGVDPVSGLNTVAIGEIVTYEIVIDLPMGSTINNAIVTDQLDLGLAFVDCVSVLIQGVDETTNVCPPTVTPVVGSSANPADDGRQVAFTLPTSIVVSAPSQQIVIRYRAIVLDVIENQSGVQMNNSATWTWTGGSFTTSTPNVEIVEPDLTLDKSASATTNVPIGTTITFTLVVDHTTPTSETDAFDVVLSDLLPANLLYIPCTATYSGLVPTTNTATCPAPASNLIFTWDVFPLGQTATITFDAVLVGAPAVNDASVAWTSLPIDPQINGLPVTLSVYNTESTERWYDPLDTVNVYGVSDSVSINAPAANVDDADLTLPKRSPSTGFAPNQVTVLPEQPKEKAYTSTNIWLEIPALGIKMPIEGVPLVNGDWDVSWLVQQAGWLEGTAFPSWKGNSVLTSHVTLADGTAGPFAKLETLAWGDQIIVRAYNTKYIFEVRQNHIVSPYNMSIFKHEESPWLTLITCKDYNESTKAYANRVVIRAVLIKSESENTYAPSDVTR